MSFEQPEEKKETKLSLKMRTWWLGKRIEIEMTGPAGSINEFAKKHVPWAVKEERKVAEGRE